MSPSTEFNTKRFCALKRRSSKKKNRKRRKENKAEVGSYFRLGFFQRRRPHNGRASGFNGRRRGGGSFPPDELERRFRDDHGVILRRSIRKNHRTWRSFNDRYLIELAGRSGFLGGTIQAILHFGHFRSRFRIAQFRFDFLVGGFFRVTARRRPPLHSIDFFRDFLRII